MDMGSTSGRELQIFESVMIMSINIYFWLANFHSLKSPLIMCQISFLTRLLLLTLPDNKQPLEYHSWIKGTVLESPKRSEWKRQWFQHVSTVKDPP